MANDEHVALLTQDVAAWNAWRKKNPDVEVDLRGARLTGAALFGVDLFGVDLSGSDLNEANLGMANLSEANLSEANLHEANLYEADLIGANLSKANLSKTNLSKTNLSKTNLSKTNLSGANEEVGVIGNFIIVALGLFGIAVGLALPVLAVLFYIWGPEEKAKSSEYRRSLCRRAVACKKI